MLNFYFIFLFYFLPAFLDVFGEHVFKEFYDLLLESKCSCHILSFSFSYIIPVQKIQILFKNFSTDRSILVL